MTVSGVMDVLAANAESVDEPLLSVFTVDVLVDLLEPHKLDWEEVDDAGADGLDSLEPQELDGLDALEGADGFDELEPQELDGFDGADGFDELEPQDELDGLDALEGDDGDDGFDELESQELGAALSENVEVINIAAMINMFVSFFICRETVYMICKEMQ